MKASTICNTAIKAALYNYGPIQYRDRNTGYGPTWEYNVMLWKDGAWHSDCLGFVHTMVNGFKGDKNVLGGGAKMDAFVLNSDEITTLNSYCSTRGKFPKKDLKKGAFLYMNGHVGLYVGEYKVKRGNGTTDVYNVAECTMSWGGGAVLSYVDVSTGKRYNKKGGYQEGAWSNWGYFDRVTYDEKTTTTEKTETVTKKKILTLVSEVLDGKWGVTPEREKKLTEKYGKSVYRCIQDIINILYRN